MGSSDGTVFIIDDDPGARESIAALVGSMGFAARVFDSAETFLEAYRGTESGCVVSDLRLRGISGLELLERLLAANAPIPVILVTAYAKTPITVRAMRRGAVNVLEKPLDEHQLWDAIREALSLDRMRRERHHEQIELQSRFDDLTQQERQVLKMLVGGLTNRQIASHLDVSTRTVEARRHNIFRKTRTSSVPDLVKLAVAYQDRLGQSDRPPSAP